MACMNSVPAYARPYAEAFKNTGHLEGDNVVRQSIPPEAFAEVEAQMTQQIDQFIALDESPLDNAKGEVGKVQVEQMGVNATLNFEGNTQSGCATLEAGGGPIPNTAAHGEFTPQAANLVQVIDLDGEQAAVGVHLDRENHANSYVEIYNAEALGGGFGLFS